MIYTVFTVTLKGSKSSMKRSEMEFKRKMSLVVPMNLGQSAFRVFESSSTKIYLGYSYCFLLKYSAMTISLLLPHQRPGGKRSFFKSIILYTLIMQNLRECLLVDNAHKRHLAKAVLGFKSRSALALNSCFHFNSRPLA